MKQSMVGLGLFIILTLPPVVDILESIMIVHMHMQMPALVLAGCLMARFFQMKFPRFFEKWNSNGIPGIILFVIVTSYWMMPRTMDEALTIPSIEVFKFISLPFLAGIALRDSWVKLSRLGKNIIIIIFTVMYFGVGWLYIYAPVQLCNNYLLIEQITLGWGFLTTAICMGLYLLYITFTDQTKYE